ncbi:hypothetical protein HYX17_00775 [Candidatus Woesearchaeota archaeon]|nr:hypothetical protein [Candidatus Woesearchaeota archaeon]
MPKSMDKKGVDLTLNTIIIAVLVILVLVVVVVFFLGGFKGLTDRIKSIFFSSTAGTDVVLAVQTCEQFCEQAKLLPKNLQPSSSYCSYAFAIEGETTKIVDKYVNAYVCGDISNVNTQKLPLIYEYGSLRSLNVNCPEIKCSSQ